MCALTSNAARSGAASSPRVEAASPKPKIDWSRVSKPGDVLKAIQQKKEEAAAPPPRPAAPGGHARATGCCHQAGSSGCDCSCSDGPGSCRRAPGTSHAGATDRGPAGSTQNCSAAAPGCSDRCAAAASTGHCRKTAGRPRGGKASGWRCQRCRCPTWSNATSCPARCSCRQRPPVAKPPVAPAPPPAPTRGRIRVSAPVEQLAASACRCCPGRSRSRAAPRHHAANRPASGLYRASRPACRRPFQSRRRAQPDPQASSADGPIFDRRPGGGPGQRPGMGGAPGGAPGAPGARRPMHPTRSAPAGGAPGARPGFGQRPGMGAAPRLWPASRTRRSSRPGAASGRSAASAACRRWTRAPWPPAVPQVQRRPDEGLRSAIAFRRSPGSRRAVAHHPHHHGDGRHQRQGSCREARSPRQGSDRGAAVARRLRHRQPVARWRTRQGCRPPVRRRHRGHHL